MLLKGLTDKNHRQHLSLHILHIHNNANNTISMRDLKTTLVWCINVGVRGLKTWINTRAFSRLSVSDNIGEN